MANATDSTFLNEELENLKRFTEERQRRNEEFITGTSTSSFTLNASQL